jgi:hypothetical protein
LKQLQVHELARLLLAGRAVLVHRFQIVVHVVHRALAGLLRLADVLGNDPLEPADDHILRMILDQRAVLLEAERKLYQE